ncbi:MAG: SDR family oxidoreductase [Bacteroidetes bacterium]|nr:SDR family oxidoreductase [Bacteroidota bacterium]
MNKSPTRFAGKNVVITGGSSGIGLATAKEFINLNANVFLLARNVERLEIAKKELQAISSKQIQVHTFPVDVSDKNAILATIEEIGSKFGGIHTLINNVGTSVHGRFEHLKLEDLEYVLEVNYLSCIYAIKAAFPFLKEAKNGHIGFVSSVAGYLGLIGVSTYAPTKFAMLGLAESLRQEMAEHDIGMTVIYPPDTDTPLLKRSLKNALPETKALSKKAKKVSPELVAQKFIEGILNKRFEVYCDFMSRPYRIIRTLFPRFYHNGTDRIIAKSKR